MIAVLALSAAVIAALSVYQFFWGFDRLENFICSHPDPSRTLLTAEYLRTRRTFFPFVTPNALGGYLAMSIPLLLSRRSLRPGLLLTVPALLLTRSIGASLSLLVALLAVFPASLYSFDRRKRLFLLIVPLVVFVSIVYLRGFSFSPTARLGYWKETLSVVAAHPVTGTGTGVFDLASSRYAHNSFLQVWAETGTVGLAALAALLFLTLSSNSGGDQDKRRWLLVSLAAFLLHNLVDFTFFLPEIGLLFWLLLGLYARPVPTPFSRRTIP
ncbi:MAG: O-antigen ligase family protein [Deltaproteobacteria bacterium]